MPDQVVHDLVELLLVEWVERDLLANGVVAGCAVNGHDEDLVDVVVVEAEFGALTDHGDGEAGVKTSW